MTRTAAARRRPAHGVGIVLAAALALVPLGAARATGITLRPCTLGGGSVEARCGTYRVPENRAVPGGRTITLRVAVLPAAHGASSPDPLVYLAGGPGGSAIADAAGVRQIFGGLNESRDIVLVDQRGTGSSHRLECPLPGKPLDAAAAIRAYVRSCLGRFQADVRQYTTVPAMEDLADVVRALGYEQVDVYGLSYGATAAQYLLAQHPELVRTAILDGATLLDVPIFERWGRNGERALRSILARCASAPRCRRAYPRVRTEVFEMMATLRRAPVHANGTVIRPADAAGAIQALSRTPDGAAQIPWIAHRARTGDWDPLAFAIDAQGTGAATTRQLMFWAIICSEPWARWSPARTRAASRGTYLAERTELDAALAAAVCSAMPKAPQPAWSRARVRSDVPVLLVVGGDDPQDPLANVGNARRELPSSRTVVVPHAGHGSLQLGCLPTIARRFVEQGTVAGLDTRCAARYTPPAFVVR
jgi:pimeloyl-ACP methyl ester carboxylesterase